MKKIISLLTILVLFASTLTASSLFRRYDEKHFNKAVQELLGHKIESYEQNIIDATYIYYFEKCNKEWNKEVWNVAVEKAYNLCCNKAAIAASKAGEAGEKLLKALVVSMEDAANSVSKWLDEKSAEYDNRNTNQQQYIKQPFFSEFIEKP